MVRRAGGELGGAGVHGLVDRPDAERPAHAADDVLAEVPQRARSGRRRSRAAWPAGARRRSAPVRRATSVGHLESSTSWSTNHGSILVASCTCSGVAPAAQRPHDHAEPAVVRAGRLAQQLRDRLGDLAG